MKTYLLSSILLVLTLFSANKTQAQQINNDTNNYVVLTKKVPQLQPIILTAEALKAQEGDAFGDFQVIICGKEIGDITDVEKMGDFVEKAEQAGVKIIACGFSLNKFKVDKTQVPKEIEIVENGILYNFQLQKKGYKSISL
ncbi:MAG TPA: sulfur reduction protein DsrE [Muricauda sp.]|jgi:intracellular sulfur oxidation DsrE/DsrF family protein|uniref:DsrE family protein n=1 Tax=Flagellimonas oceanensis TaxID=2499163 RepID=UPI000C92C1A5|nr:sulfur reduction protein DsrE [Allomuricauda oceanensis]MAO16658.1 sulfur reduction protein DsrE [Allomuricauda sp.]MCR9066683.1 sulfur reduction protein DsrE [Cytophagales bacterium]HBU77934.1 sulfur reduction protein DsrE [Allomuricauda sp.]|tara:strand:+ start:1945 stop:2367 length:423 start_codon:yes stop_codon:yes gene_type:complete